MSGGRILSGGLPDCVLYINWDGFAYKWYEMVNEAYAGTPNLNALLADGTLLTRSETGVPSITGAMQQCIASGVWPADTGNYNKYYNLQDNRVVAFGRHNPLENVAEAALRRGLSVASVNAWYFENQGTFEGSAEAPYIQAGLPSNFGQRVDALVKVIRGEPVVTGGRTLTFDSPPRLLSVYADDIDTVGHNVKVTYEGLRVAETRGEWYDNLARTIMYMDADLGRLIAALNERGVYERTAIVLTSDHGMVQHGAAFREEAISAYPPEAFTSLPDLAETIALAGMDAIGRRYRVEVLHEAGAQAGEETEIVVVPVALQAQLTFRVPFPVEAACGLLARLQAKPYYGGHLGYEELVVRGAGADYADLLISARPPFCFRPDPPESPRIAAANHDSLHGQVRRVFTLVAGAGARRGAVCDERVTIADIAPTIARLLGFEGPRDAVGKAVDAALIEELRGPRLVVEEAAADGLLAGLTEPGAEIRVNRVSAGAADRMGKFRIAVPLRGGVNRLVVESEYSGRKTREVVYIQSESDEVSGGTACVRQSFS